MHKSGLAFTFAFLACLLTAGQQFCRAQDGPGASASRIWKTKTGAFTTNATLLKFEDGFVHLQKQDGSIVSLSIDRLTDADQEYVKKNTKSHAADGKTTSDASPTKSSNKDETSELVVKCQQLCEEITKGYKGKEAGKKATIAVVEFSDLSGGVTDLGRLLSEELITKLFATGNYKVVERLLLNKAIADHKLQLQGLIDPKSVKELGKILGVDAVVSGTVADLGDSVRINARLISTETGEVFSVASATINKDDTIKVLLGRTGGSSGATRSSRGTSGKAQLPFREDFSSYKDGETTDWGQAAKVRTGEDGRKWLVPSGNGQKPIGMDIELPQDAYIEFDYIASQLESKYQQDRILSAISLIDEEGDKFTMELIIDVNEGTSIGHWSEYTIRLPGGTKLSDQGSDMGNHERSLARGTLRVLRAGDTITVGRDGSRHQLTAKVSDFKGFTRLEVDIYKGKNSMIAFTNFKIGKKSTDK